MASLDHIPLELLHAYVMAASVVIGPVLGLAAFAVAWMVRPQ